MTDAELQKMMADARAAEARVASGQVQVLGQRTNPAPAVVTAPAPQTIQTQPTQQPQQNSGSSDPITQWMNSGSQDSYDVWLAKKNGTYTPPAPAVMPTNPNIVNGIDLGTPKEGAVPLGQKENTPAVVAPIDYATIDMMADEAVANGLISQIDADLFKQITKQYSGSSVNYENIIKEFEKISKNTIDPEYAERAKTFGADLLSQKKYMEDTRAMELEQEGNVAKSNIENTQRNLENSGLTFSGAAVKELGEKSAYSQAQSGNTIAGGVPTQIPLGGTFAEGEVNKANRLMSTSSQARQAKAFQDLGRKAEDYLGQAGASAYGINYTPAGVAMGTLERDKIKAKTSTLQNLYGNYQTEQQRNSTQLNQ